MTAPVITDRRSHGVWRLEQRASACLDRPGRASSYRLGLGSRRYAGYATEEQSASDEVAQCVAHQARLRN